MSSANRRVQKFRADHVELRSQFDRLKGENASAVSGNHLAILSVIVSKIYMTRIDRRI
jgi:hypothetical protein